eukprot:SAG31_NODE_31912_length_362_cov_0.984791_1_plen_61_part_01
MDAADTAEVADAAAADVKLLVFEAAQTDHDDDALSSSGSGDGPGSSLYPAIFFSEPNMLGK